MPISRTQTFTLFRHAATASQAVHGIAGRVTRSSGRLRVSFVLGGDVERLYVPEPRAKRFTDGLWRHTCFELFVLRNGCSEYLEFNFSPSGEWAAYPFMRYRERASLAGDLSAIDPCVTVRRSKTVLELEAIVQLEELSPRYADAMLALGVSAVIEDRAGSHSFWALEHPCAKPDFHHPDGFVLKL